MKLSSAVKIKRPPLKTSFCLLLFFLPLGLQAAELSFKGYLENRTLLNFDSSALAGRNRARVELSAYPTDQAYVNLTADFINLHGDLSQVKALLPGEDLFVDRVSLDRAYLRLNLRRWKVIAGKQRIAWGQSLIWSPFDVFNRINLLEPAEEKSGINAFHFSLPFSATSGAEATVVPQSDLDASAYGVRSYFTMLNTGVDFYAIRDALNPKEREIFGFALKGDFMIGWWFEGAYVAPNPDSRLESVVGIDYTFSLGDGLYLLFEYRYNGSGNDEPKEYDYKRLLTDRRPLLGRNYASCMMRYNLSPLMVLTMAYTVNLDDRSGILTPSLQYQLFQDLQTTLGANIFLGEGEYHIPEGRLPFEVDHQAYLWLRADF